ncbi:hypothetical protein QUS59_23020, partial [Xanthomonas citri pv. citri]
MNSGSKRCSRLLTVSGRVKRSQHSLVDEEQDWHLRVALAKDVRRQRVAPNGAIPVMFRGSHPE